MQFAETEISKSPSQFWAASSRLLLLLRYSKSLRVVIFDSSSKNKFSTKRFWGLSETKSLKAVSTVWFCLVTFKTYSFLLILINILSNRISFGWSISSIFQNYNSTPKKNNESRPGRLLKTKLVLRFGGQIKELYHALGISPRGSISLPWKIYLAKKNCKKFLNLASK